MPHLSQIRGRTEQTPTEWLKFGTQVARFVNDRSGRDDIIAFLGKGAGGGAAACFCPAIAEIELDIRKCYGALVTPTTAADPNIRANQFDHPIPTGAMMHEAAHAEWTLWDLKQLQAYASVVKNDLACQVALWFEESRIEKLSALKFPVDVPFLRSSALGIVMSDLDLTKVTSNAPFYVAQLLLLAPARVDAGTLEDEDVEELREVLVDYFGQETYDKFRALWLKAQAITNHAGAFVPLITLAEEWLKLLPKDPELTEDQKNLLGRLQEMMENAQASAEIGGHDDAADQEQHERDMAKAQEKQEAAQEAKSHQQVASRVFAKSTSERFVTNTTSYILETRSPRPREQAAAVIIGRQLEKARYRDRVTTQHQGTLPPGRLNTREAIQGVAQREQGRMVTAQPWKRTERRHVEDPKLTIGVAVDISGSMDPAMEAMAVTAWVLAAAGHRIQATVAQVYFGNAVFPTLKPGQRMPEVVVRTANDSVEKFEQAFKAIDGALNLLNGRGARLLVICSDTCWKGGEPAALERWTRRCIKAGVGVLILPFDEGYDVQNHDLPREVQVLTGTLDPAGAAMVIGRAAAKALESASADR